MRVTVSGYVLSIFATANAARHSIDVEMLERLFVVSPHPPSGF